MKTTFFKLALLAGLLTLMAACADESNTVETPPDINVMGMSTMTSLELTSEMGTGWNLGNTLEHEEDHGGNNPEPTQQLFDAIKAAGFKTVRIPVAWSKFIDETNFTIDPAWLDHVEKVVNYARSNDMYVILNEHFDGDWIRPTYTQQAYVNSRLDIMWKQIATRFKDYDYHLLFAGTNEVKIEGYHGTVTAEHIEVQNSFNQTFVNAVRSTGGRNTLRYLVVQSYNTEIDWAVEHSILPEDSSERRLLMEVHFYNPLEFTIDYESNIIQWGSIATDVSLTIPGANEEYVNGQFQKIKTHFIDQGIGVLLGEYGAIARPDVPERETFREYYIDYVSTSARSHGLVPIYWDNGDPDLEGTFAIFDRNTYDVVYPGILAAVLP